MAGYGLRVKLLLMRLERDMCYGCWEEDGKPEVLSVKTRTLAKQAKGFDEFGGLYVILANWNIEPEHFEFCKSYETTTLEEAQWCEAMLTLTHEERSSVMAMHYDFLPIL